MSNGTLAPPQTPTCRRVILAAAIELQVEHAGPWPIQALIVRAWKLAPRLLGLDGFEAEYPDAHRVASHVCGDRGLAGRRGWLRRVGSGLYEVGPAGWDEYHRMGDAG